MTIRLMLACAAALALGAATLLAQPDAPAERVASRAEILAAHPPRALAVAAPAACGPVLPAAPAAADI